MIIVHIHRTAWPVLGGVERAIQRICEELIKIGHEVHIVTSAYGVRNRVKCEEFNGIHIHRVKALTLHFPDLTIPREIPRDILKKADIIQGWSQNSYFTYRICEVAKRLGKRIAMYFLGIDYLRHHHNSLIRLLGYQYQKWVTRKVIKVTDLILVTNEHEKQILKEKYNVNSVVVPHGIDEIYLKLPNMARHFKRKYNIEERIIAYIGRIHPTKGLDLLIKAYAKVAKQVSDTIVVVAGKGDKKYLKKCLELAKKLGVSNRIKYIGYVSEEDKIALIDAAEIVVLPSRHVGESFPLIIYEVKSRKTPIIVTAAGMLKYHIKQGFDGLITPVGDVDVLAKAITQLLVDTNLHTRIRSNLANEYGQIKSWHEVTLQMLRIYEDVARYR